MREGAGARCRDQGKKESSRASILSACPVYTDWGEQMHRHAFKISRPRKQRGQGRRRGHEKRPAEAIGHNLHMKRTRAAAKSCARLRGFGNCRSRIWLPGLLRYLRPLAPETPARSGNPKTSTMEGEDHIGSHGQISNRRQACFGSIQHLRHSSLVRSLDATTMSSDLALNLMYDLSPRCSNLELTPV